MRLLQDPRLSLRTLGSIDDEQIIDGVHLRWSFAPELGFPPHGFRLSVRPSRQAEGQVADIAAAAGPLVGNPPPGLRTDGVTVHRADGRPLAIERRCNSISVVVGPHRVVIAFRDGFGAPRRTVREVVLHGAVEQGTVTARALHGDRVAACGSAAQAPGSKDCTAFSLRLQADAIDTVELSGDGLGVLLRVAYVIIDADDRHGDWEGLAEFCLPLDASPSYPCPPQGTDPYAVAKSRLPDPSELPPGAPSWDDLADRLLGDGFAELVDTLQKMLDDPTPPHLQRFELTADEGDDDTVFRSQPLHHVLLGCLDPYFARIVGLYHVDTKHLDGTWDYLIEAEWSVDGDTVDLGWIAYDVAAVPAPPLEAPTGVTATAMQGLSRLLPDGSVERHQMDVGVRWDQPTACDAADAARAAIAYFVERTEPDGEPDGPYEPATGRDFEGGGRPEVVPVLLGVPHDPSAPFPLGHFVDRAPGYGVFWYRVLGRDLFGRTSPPSDPAKVLVRDEVAPGSPMNLVADYVDPADLERAGSEVLAWANRDTPPGAPERPATIVRWTWPVSRQRQAPDATEFRLYYRAGVPNAVSGGVTSVTRTADREFRVQTDLPAVAPDLPAGTSVDIGVLRNEGEDYVVRSLRTTPSGLQLTVTAHPASPPLPGAATFALGAGRPARPGQPAKPPHPGWRSFREASHWGGLVVDAKAAPVPLRIGLDGKVRSPLPSRIGAGDVTVRRSSEKADEGGEHAHYELWLRNLVLGPTPARPRATGSFGITAVDDASPANEGRVSAPAAILALHRTPPAIPQLPPDDVRHATTADWHGRSTVTLDWPATAGTGYLVYRASDAALLASAEIDPAAHRALPAPQQRQQLREIGSRQASAGAFAPVTPEPLWATASGTMRHRDSLDGTLRNRFVYRLRACDRTGVLAPWPPDPPPVDAGRVAMVVEIPPSVPPSPPRWAGTDSGEAGVTLRWVANAEADLAGYRLYRSAAREAAADPRSMAAVLATLLSAEQTAYLDGDTEGGRTSYYRLVAEDTFGNRSRPSEVLAVRPPKRQPPAPPAWLSLAATDDGVAGSWSADEDDLETLVRRRRPGDPLWRPVGTWTTATTFLDGDVEPGAAYEYAVRVRDRVGHVVDGPALAVTA
jgi:hypothetical protein